MYYNVFTNVTATAYYPIKNYTWTSDVMWNRGGTITWVAICTKHKETVAAAVEPTCTQNGLKEGA